MAENILSVRLRHAAKTLTQWQLITTIPKLGEICLEADSTTPPLKYKIKIGDGNLPYYDNTAGAVIGADYLPYFEGTDSSGNNIATVISNWIVNNLDVNEYAQAEWNSTNSKLRIYGIKEVDGKIARGTNHVDIAVGNLLTISESNGTVTIAHNTVARGDTDNDTNLGDQASVITGVTTDGCGHVTGVTTYKLPTITHQTSKNVVGDSASATADAAVSSDPFLNHLEDSTVTSSHQIKGGDKITVSSNSTGDISIDHDAQTQTDTTGSQLAFGDSVVTGVSVDSQGHVTGKKTSALPNNPVSSSNNGRIMVGDGDNTTSESLNAITDSVASNVNIPTNTAIIDYVSQQISIALASALFYRGTVASYANLEAARIATGDSAIKVGDLYVASAGFTHTTPTTYLPAGSYEAGDFFIWNGSSWDVVQGENQVTNSNPTLALDGSTQAIGTVDGTTLQVTNPNLHLDDPTANGNGLEFIATTSQINGKVAATKKTVQDGTTSQKGVVQLASSHDGTDTTKGATGATVKEAIDDRFVEDVHYATDNDKYVSARQVWQECDKRNVQFVEEVDFDDLNIDEETFIAKYTYGIGWIDDAATCTRVGESTLLSQMPIHKSLRACVNEIINEQAQILDADNNVLITYPAQRRFMYWLDDDDWTKQYGNGEASVLDGSNNTNISIWNVKFYYKSFDGIASAADHVTTGTYNEFRISMLKFDDTWTEFKEGYTDFAKMQTTTTNGRITAGSFGNPNFGTTENLVSNPRDNEMTYVDMRTWITKSVGDVALPLSTTGLDRAIAHTYALNSGAHLLSYDEYKVLFYWLPAIEFGTFQIESDSIFDWNNNDWNDHTISRDSLNLATGSYGYCGIYSDNYAEITGPSGFNTWAFIPAGYTNALGTNTGWVKMRLPNSGGTYDTKIISRWRGFEIQRNIWTNVYGVWPMQTSTSGKCEIFASKNRSLWNNNIPIRTIGGSVIGAAPSNMPLWSVGVATLETINTDIVYKGQQNGSGYGKEFDLGSDGNIMFSKLGGNKNDYSYGDMAANNPRWLICGGSAYSSSAGGPGYLYSDHVASTSDDVVGFRCRWNYDEYTSVYN